MLARYIPVRALRALSFLGVLALASALLPLEVRPGADILGSKGARSDSEQRAEQDRPTLPADLNGLLEATRARLEELRQATANLAADAQARPELQRLQQENERLAAAERGRDAEAERLRTELAEAKEQLSQATAAAAATQRARQAALAEADTLRSEAERARQELSASKAEMQRLTTAKAELEQQLISLRMESVAATKAAREIQRMAKLNADLFGGARPGAGPAPGQPEVIPDPVETEEPAAAALPAAIPQPPAPERPAETAAGGPTADTPEPPTTGPDETTSETAAGLAHFRAAVQVLNGLERRATGLDLFAEVASVSAGAVDIHATPAWDALPSIAKETYLDTLLDNWAATQAGDGRAVVRILDPGGRVLLEKSSP